MESRRLDRMTVRWDMFRDCGHMEGIWENEFCRGSGSYSYRSKWMDKEFARKGKERRVFNT